MSPSVVRWLAARAVWGAVVLAPAITQADTYDFKVVNDSGLTVNNIDITFGFPTGGALSNLVAVGPPDTTFYEQNLVAKQITANFNSLAPGGMFEAHFDATAGLLGFQFASGNWTVNGSSVAPLTESSITFGPVPTPEVVSSTVLHTVVVDRGKVLPWGTPDVVSGHQK
jgi:hypothetical protein